MQGGRQATLSWCGWRIRKQRSMQASEIRGLADGLLEVALAAARALMTHFGTGMEVKRKADATPVTAADRQAEEIILAGLARVAPGVAIVAEEEVAAGRIPDISGGFFLVDPLDGTNGFIKGRREFTINIGLIEAGRPGFGPPYAPAPPHFFVTRPRHPALKPHLEPPAPPPQFAGCGF